jgi:hypothetical protein
VRWTAVPVIALLAVVSLPASAVAGYDIAHIIKRTCVPGGPLIGAHKWNRDRVPGEVIACPPAGRSSSFQIAAGPDRIGREAVLCTYISLRGADGADLCVDPESTEGVTPLIVIQADRSDRLQLVGIAASDVATVTLAGRVIPIGRQRAARLGATRAFRYFSQPVDRRSLCADESAVPATTALLSAADRVPHARSLDGDFCWSKVPQLPEL